MIDHITQNLQRFQTSIELIQGKWSINVVYKIYILEEPSYNELLKALPGINSRTLTDRLRIIRDAEDSPTGSAQYKTTPCYL